MTALRISNRAVAEKVVRMAERHSEELNRTLAECATAMTGDEFSSYKQATGMVMGSLFVELMDPIYRQYPDLEPSWMAGADESE